MKTQHDASKADNNKHSVKILKQNKAWWVKVQQLIPHEV